MARKASQKVSADIASNDVSASSPSAIVRKEPEDVSKPKMVHSEHYHTIYSNYSKVGITQWDFSVSFGQSLENKEGESLFEERVAIKFSPQYFKAMVLSLANAMERWEQTFGEIPSGLGQRPNTQGIDQAFDRLKGVLAGIDDKPKKAK